MKLLPDSPLDFALHYAAIGWHVLPVWPIVNGHCGCHLGEQCNAPGKHPLNKLARQGQCNSTTNEAIIRRWWSLWPDAHIGIHLSPSGLCAVDIDPRNGGHYTMEDLEDRYGPITSDVLQFSGGGGQHIIYTKPDSLHSLPGTLGKGVDLKLNGYLVAEPSGHISGGHYLFEAHSSPLDGYIPSPLPDWIQDMARIALHTNDESETVFHSRLVSANQIEDLRNALKTIDADDRDTWLRMGAALKTIGATGWDLWLEYSKKSEKFKQCDQLRVWKSFHTKHLNIETVFYTARQAGWDGMPSEVDINISQLLTGIAMKPVIAPLAVVALKEITRLPGILGEIEDYYNATAPIPQPAFAQQTAIGILSVLLGRRFKSSFDDYTSLYLACIAPSSCGKEHVKTVSGDILKACNKDLLAGDGYTSAGAIFSALKEKPAHLAIIDELGLYLEASSNKNNHIGRGANTLLMECIGRLKREVRSKNYSTHGLKGMTSAEIVVHPAISLLGLTTPSTFYKNINLDMVKDGFLGRFIVVHSTIPRVPLRRVRPLPVPQSITDWSIAIDSRIVDPLCAFANYGLIGEQCIIDIDDQALAVLDDFSQEMVDLMNILEGESLEALVGRSAEFAGRLALIVALSCNSQAMCVGVDSAKVAINYVRKCALDLVCNVRENMVGSEYQQAKNEILTAIRASKNGVTEGDMNRKAPYSKHKNRDLAEIIQSLVKAELIVLMNTREGKAGVKRMAYFASMTQDEFDIA